MHGFMIVTLLGSLMIGAAAMAWSSTATAQEGLAVGACAADVKSLCAGTEPGQNRIRGCLREHINDVSESCLTTLAKLAGVDQACRAHLNQECARVTPGEGQVEACLRSAIASLSNACKDALARAVGGF